MKLLSSDRQTDCVLCYTCKRATPDNIQARFSGTFLRNSQEKCFKGSAYVLPIIKGSWISSVRAENIFDLDGEAQFGSDFFHLHCLKDEFTQGLNVLTHGHSNGSNKNYLFDSYLIIFVGDGSLFGSLRRCHRARSGLIFSLRFTAVPVPTLVTRGAQPFVLLCAPAHTERGQ